MGHHASVGERFESPAEEPSFNASTGEQLESCSEESGLRANLHQAELVLGVAHDDIAANETLLGNIHNSKPTRWGRSRQP